MKTSHLHGIALFGKKHISWNTVVCLGFLPNSCPTSIGKVLSFLYSIIKLIQADVLFPKWELSYNILYISIQR